MESNKHILFGICIEDFISNITAKVCAYNECIGCPYYMQGQPCLLGRFVIATEKAALAYDTVEIEANEVICNAENAG